MPVFIHPGLHKTGTTFLQHEIFKKIPGVNCFRNVGFDTVVDEDEINIISNEDLSGASYWGGNADIRFVIADRLKLWFPNAKIILTVRPGPGWVNSLYSQFIKHGGLLSFEDWRECVFDERYLNIDEYVNYFQMLFDDVLVIDFNQLCFNKEAIINRLFKFLDVDKIDYRDIKHNIKLSPFQLKLCRFLNRFWVSDWNKNGLFPRTPHFKPVFIIRKLDIKRRLQQ